MTHDYKLEKVMAYGTGLQCTKSHDSLITWLYSLMTNKKRYISNSKCPMDTKLDRVLAYGMGPTLNKSHHSN